MTALRLRFYRSFIMDRQIYKRPETHPIDPAGKSACGTAIASEV